MYYRQYGSMELDSFIIHGPVSQARAACLTISPQTAAFLALAGLGRRVVQLKAKGVFFSQGGPADSIFYLQKGRAKMTVVSEAGKQATVTLLAAGDFVGEESVAG